MKHAEDCMSTSPDGGPCTCRDPRDRRTTRRMQVFAFHEKYGHPVALLPTVPNEEQIRFRLKLIAEEFLELLDAAGIHPWMRPADPTHTFGEHLRRCIEEAYVREPDGSLRVDLPAFVDALADLDYVIEGTRLVFGVDGEPIAAEVHRANMDKKALYECAHCGNQKVVHPGGAEEEQCLGCESDDGEHHYPPGKPVKPMGWRPPDIAGELKKQGWKP